MPLYDYVCQKCGISFESFVDVEHRNQVLCECGARASKLISTGMGAASDSRHRDFAGQPIWYPKHGKPYYDRFFGKTFISKKHKSEYMIKNRLVMDGPETMPDRRPVEAGDMRYKSKRRAAGLED